MTSVVAVLRGSDEPPRGEPLTTQAIHTVCVKQNILRRDAPQPAADVSHPPHSRRCDLQRLQAAGRDLSSQQVQGAINALVYSLRDAVTNKLEPEALVNKLKGCVSWNPSF